MEKLKNILGDELCDILPSIFISCLIIIGIVALVIKKL
jgi:hypothetical protein